MKAETTKAMGVKEDGTIGCRGFRTFCGECSFLSRVYKNIRSAQALTQAHNREYHYA
jgi:hypothetical protein